MATTADRSRPSRRDGGSVRGDRATQARAEPDHRDAGRSRVLSRLRVRARRRGDLVRRSGEGRRSRSTCSIRRRPVGPNARAQPTGAGRPRLVHVGRPRQSRSDRPGGRVPAARPARAKRAHDRPPQPDSGGHDGSADQARARLPARVLAGRRREPRPRHRHVRDQRARACDDARRRPAGACSSKFPGRRGQARLVRASQRPCRAGRAPTRSACAPSIGPGTGRRERARCPSAFATSSSRATASRSSRASASRCAFSRTRLRTAGSSRASGGPARVRFSSCGHPRAGHLHPLRLGRGSRGPGRGRRLGTAPCLEAAALRPRREPLGHDVAARDPRPLARDRHSRRDVLHPAAGSPTFEPGRSGCVPRRPSPASTPCRLGRVGRRSSPLGCGPP